MLLRIAAVVLAALYMTTQVWAGPAEDNALKIAIEKLDTAAVTTSLNLGANPNAILQGRETALGLTVLYSTNFEIPNAAIKAVEIAKVLFAKGAKIGVLDHDVLFLAISEGNIALVSLLLDKGASPAAKVEGYLPTELAIKYRQPEVYKLLVSRGGIPVGRQEAAQQVLVQAAGEGDIEGMERALAAGARVNDPDAAGETALLAAVKFARPVPVAIWLLDRGADPNGKGESGLKGLEGIPLHVFVAMSKAFLEGSYLGSAYPPEIKRTAEGTLSRLLKAGAKVSGMDSRGRTPLHVAAQFDNVRSAEVLIHEGARVMARDASGKTPLDYAESAAMIRLLKANGATE